MVMMIETVTTVIKQYHNLSIDHDQSFIHSYSLYECSDSQSRLNGWPHHTNNNCTIQWFDNSDDLLTLKKLVKKQTFLSLLIIA